MPLFSDTNALATLFPCVDFVLAAGCCGYEACILTGGQFQKLKPMGLKWNNEFNDHKDRTGRVNWTNSGIYLEPLKTNCNSLGPVHDGHSFEKRQRTTNAQSTLVKKKNMMQWSVFLCINKMKHNNNLKFLVRWCAILLDNMQNISSLCSAYSFAYLFQMFTDESLVECLKSL